MSSEAPISAVDIEQAVKRFAGAWQRGEQPVIGDYCKQGDPRADALLQALVLVDFERRLKAGETRRAEDYLREYPRLHARKEAVLELSRIEARWKGGEPSASKATDGDASRDSVSHANVKSSGAAIETAASGADLSVIEPTRTCSGDVFSAPDFSGETVSAEEPPSLSRLPVPLALGKFQLIEVVGQGGFGTVYRGKDTELGRDVAVKFPKKDMLGTDKERERFIREARSAAALRHPNLVPIYEVGGTHERPFIVSAFVEGSTLSKALAARKFEPHEAAKIVRDLAKALHYAHEKGIIHRDVKPANIMLDEHAEPFLMDFGLARRDGEAVITHEGTILGTPAYMSPEQAQGRPVDARTDVYSLGVVLYELLTCERPFQGNVQSVLHQVVNAEPPSPKLANRAVPPDLEQICLKCLEKAPDDRYASAQELERDLSRFLEGLPVGARPISRVARGWRWARRHPKTAILIAVTAVLGISLPVVQTINRYEVARSNRRLDEEKENARLVEEANRARLEKLFVSRGNERIEAGNPMLALPWFAAALEPLPEGAPSNAAHRVRLVTTMEGQRLSRFWRARGPIISVARCPTRPLLAIAPSAPQAAVLDLGIPARPPLALRHPNTLLQCAFSPEGKRLVLSCTDHNVRVWLTSALSGIPLILRHDSMPTCIAFDPGGRLLAVATEGGAVHLWDVSTGALLAPVLGHPNTVNHLAFNSEGSLLAAAGSDGAMHLWSAATRAEVAVRKLGGPVNYVGFGPGGELLLAGSDDGTVRAWDAKSHDQKFEFSVSSPVVRLAFSADGSLMAAGCGNGRVHVWNLKTQDAVQGDFRHEQSVRSLSFSSDGQTLVTAGDDDTVRVWNLKTGLAKTPPFVCTGHVEWAELTDDQQHVMAAGLDGILREWSLANALRTEHRCADIVAPENVTSSPNGRWLLLSGEKGRPVLCDLSAPRFAATTLPDTPGCLRAAFAPDGNSLVVVGTKGELSLWDLSQQPKLIRRQRGNGLLKDVRFSPDGQSLVTANIDGSARVFSLARAEAILTLRHGLGLKRAFFNSDGHKIYTVGGPRGLCLWDVGSGNVVSEYRDASYEIDDCRLTRDGRLLLAVFRGAQPGSLFNALTLEPIRQILMSPISAGFSEDGTRLVTTDHQNVARIWDVTAEELARSEKPDSWSADKALRATSPHRSAARCCAIRADGSLIATGSDDKTARVWDAESGEPVSPPLEHSDRVIFVGFRDAGNQLVTVSADAVIRIWTLDDGTPTERLIHLARATSGQRIDENGTAIALKPAQIEEEWNAANGATNPDSK